MFFEVLGAINRFHELGCGHSDITKGNVAYNLDHKIIVELIVVDLGAMKPLGSLAEQMWTASEITTPLEIEVGLFYGL